MGVMFLDLDNFKTVNDTLGHDFGDDLLKLVAARLGRPSGGDTVARFGGDEFTILLESLNDRADAVTVAERIVEIDPRASRAWHHRVASRAFSIGIAFGVSGRDQSDVLLRHADLAMYRAKTNGKGCFEAVRPEHDTDAKERLEMEAGPAAGPGAATSCASTTSPSCPSRRARSSAMEALIRWEHSERGMVGPSQFIPVAEGTGLIVPLGQWVLGEACRQIKRWQDRLSRRPAS